MEAKPERALLTAVLFQAIKDSKHQKHREDAQAFVESEYFEWLWGMLCKQAQRMPDVATARRLIINGDVSVPRGAYH